MECRSSVAVCCSLTRLGYEVGFPTHFLVDQDSALLKVLSEAEINLMDAQYAIKKAVRIDFNTCPVGGHYYHGLVKRKIRSVQEIMARH